MDIRDTQSAIAAFVKNMDEKNEKPIARKELSWDFFYIFITTTILGLTALDFIAEFFVGNSVSCFPPPDTLSVVTSSGEEIYGFALRQADYINQFCYQSTTTTRYLPLLFLAQGIAMSIPHSLWAVFFSGEFDSFFTVTQKLTLHSQTGQFSKKPENISRLGELEKRFGKNGIIYLFYITKLVLQLLVCISFIFLSGLLFNDFTTSFVCPDSLDNAGKNIPEGWPLNCTVSCVYTSLILFRVVWIANLILTLLALLVTCLGILWITLTPKSILGSEERVKYLSTYNISERFQLETKAGWILDDMDFLLYLLSRIDPIKAERFKDIQIHRKLAVLNLNADRWKDSIKGNKGNIKSEIGNIIDCHSIYLDVFILEISFESFGFGCSCKSRITNVISVNFDPYYDGLIIKQQNFEKESRKTSFFTCIHNKRFNSLEADPLESVNYKYWKFVNDEKKKKKITVIIVGHVSGDYNERENFQILLDEMTKKKCVENGALLLVVRILKIDSFVEFKPNGDDWYKLVKTEPSHDFEITTFAYKIKEFIEDNIEENNDFLGHIIDTAINNGRKNINRKPILLYQPFWSIPSDASVSSFYQGIAIILCGPVGYAMTMKILAAYGLFKFRRDLENYDEPYDTFASIEYKKQHYLSVVWKPTDIETIDYKYYSIKEAMKIHKELFDVHIWAIACILNIKIFIQQNPDESFEGDLKSRLDNYGKSVHYSPGSTLSGYGVLFCPKNYQQPEATGIQNLSQIQKIKNPPRTEVIAEVSLNSPQIEGSLNPPQTEVITEGSLNPLQTGVITVSSRNSPQAEKIPRAPPRNGTILTDSRNPLIGMKSDYTELTNEMLVRMSFSSNVF